MLSEYMKFALDCIVHVGIMVVLCGLTVTMIAFLGGFLFWFIRKATTEKSKWMD